MPQSDPPPASSDLHHRALSRWDERSGAPVPDPTQLDPHEPTNAELVHLRIRVIALENMIIAVLAEGSDRQLEVAREMSEYISPRMGATPHPLTIQAAKHMTDFIERAKHFRAQRL